MCICLKVLSSPLALGLALFMPQLARIVQPGVTSDKRLETLAHERLVPQLQKDP